MEIRIFECTAKDQNDKPLHFKIAIPFEKKVGYAVKLAKNYLKDVKHERLNSENFKPLDSIPHATMDQEKSVLNQGFSIEKITKNCP